MYVIKSIVSSIMFSLVLGGLCFAKAEANPAATKKKSTTSAKTAEINWIKRTDKAHSIGCDDWITAAWTTMLIKQGIVPAKDAGEVARVVLELLENRGPGRTSGWTYFHKTQDWFAEKLGQEVGGNVMVVRTTPPARQVVLIRYNLLKRMCQIYDLQEAMLNLAEKHADTIMPGYTHTRHAQPTTFGHYILSAADAIQRSTATLDLGYHQMSLNELGCGALAGTSLPIDRDLVSAYLGMEGLIENCNDAVGYTDGFLVVVCGLTNITNILSRIALEMAFWSGTEYGFLEIGSHGKSFLMPQKSSNPNSLEVTRLTSGQMIGQLTASAIAGLREPHGDGHGMLHMEDSTMAALDLASRCLQIMTHEMRAIRVNKERMLSVIRESYIASTELANQMVRDQGLDYRTAHDIIHNFVVESRKQNIPATKARVELLDEAARKMIGKKTGMTDERLRELLDPAHFIKVTNSKGGVAPEEMARMIADRRKKLAEARAKHLKRIGKLEDAQKLLYSDLNAFAQTDKKQ